MLETESRRIKKSDLPYRLGIDRIDWLFACYEGMPTVRWSGDGTSLIPQLAWEGALKKLTSRCQHEFLAVDAIAKDLDLEALSSTDLNDIERSESLVSIRSGSTGDAIYLTNNELVDKVERQISSNAEIASNQRINLSQSLPAVPNGVLRRLATNVISAGQLEDDGDDLVFVPPGYEAAQAQQSQANHEARIQQLLEQYENNDFVLVDPDSSATAAEYAQEVFTRYTGLSGVRIHPLTIDVGSTIKLVAQPGLLTQTVQELEEEAATLVSNDVDNLIQLLDENTQSRLVSKTSEPALARLLFDIPYYSDEIALAVEEAISERYRKQHDEFAATFRREVFIPVQLYAMGIKTILDPKLRQNLNDYIPSYFCNEIIADFVKSSRVNAFLSKGKSSVRELQKFVERSEQAKGIDDLLSSMEKFAKKTSIASPREEHRRVIRRQVLERKVSAEMPKMTRGSDILQNLIWILLSIATEKPAASGLPSPFVNGASAIPATPSSSLGEGLALFMSPGKDTGRMIKQYSAIAPDESEISNKLALWRDKLKVGSETKEDLDEMKKLALNIVSRMPIDSLSIDSTPTGEDNA